MTGFYENVRHSFKINSEKKPTASELSKDWIMLTNWILFFSGYQTEIYSFTLAKEFNFGNSC